MPGNEFGGFEDFADDLDEFADRLGTARRRIEDEVGGNGIDPAVEAVARSVKQEAQRLAPVGEYREFSEGEPGELRDSAEVERLSNGNWLVKFTADHAKPQEYGARRHPITPDEAEALRFRSRITGEIVITQFVFHPGHDDQSYLRPSLDTHRDIFPDAIVDEIEEILDEEL